MEIYVIVLLVFMIIGTIIAIETKSLLSSVISVGAVGIGMSITFLLLMAPDLAIVQIAVEVVLLIFLIRATIKRDVVPERGHVRWAGLIISSALVLAVMAFAVFALRDLHPFGEPVIAVVKDAPSNLYIAQGVEDTGASNIVTSILLDYRAYDTLGEATVLFTAVIGALAILRGRSRNKGRMDK